jgi:hypothetical protein
MNNLAPTALVFPDRRHRGRFPVRDDRGRLVAYIATSWTGTSFTATDADEHPVCAASQGWLGLSGRWRATGPDGEPLLEVSSGVLRPRAEVTLQRGGVFLLRGSAWRRDFIVTDPAGETVLGAVPRTPALSFRQHDYAVAQARPVFGLPEIVALVQIWRMVRKNEASAAAGSAATSTAVYGGS